MANAVVSSTTPNGPLVNSNGTATYAFIKWMQSIGTLINGSFDVKGNYQGDIGPQAAIAGRKTLASIVQYIDTGGVVTGPGVDFARAYLNKDTDHIGDGTGSPLAGGKVAYAALVESDPEDGEVLGFDGTEWVPVQKAHTISKEPHKWLDSFSDATGEFTQSQPDLSDISGVPEFAHTIAAAPSKWLNSYNATTGAFTNSQPAFSDVSGTASASQVPALSSLSGQITTGQLPASGLSATIATAKLTTGGANGSMTFTNGILTAQTPAT